MNAEPHEVPSGRRKRKRQRTADFLADVAFGLFERDGFDAVTMDLIATTADVARGTLYNHFPVKEALLDHYFQVEFQTGIGSLVADVLGVVGLEKQLTHLFDVFSDWASGKRRYLPHCLDYGLRAGRRLEERPAANGLRRVFASVLAGASERGEIQSRADVDALAEYLEHLYFAAIVRWLASSESSPQMECRRMLALFLHGAKAQSRPSGRKVA